MNRIVKKILIAAGLLAALIIIGVIAAVALVDVNSYKPKIEAAALDATGLELKINGKISLSFLPVGVSVNDIHISNRQGQIVGLKTLTIGVEVMPLLKKEIKVSRCDLVNPVINIVKDTNGKFNFEETEKTPVKKEDKKPQKDAKGAAAVAAFTVESLNITDGMLVYLDKKSGDKVELRSFGLSIKNFMAGTGEGEMMKKISFTGNFSAKELQQKKIVISNIKSSIKAEKGVFTLPAISMEAFDGKGDGDLRADMSGGTTGIKLDFKLAKFNLEKLQAALDQKKNIGGNADMAMAITAHGKEAKQITSSLNGTMSIRGENLILYTMDIDKKLSKIESKDSIGFLDLGTAFGLDTMLGGKQETQEQGALRKLVSDWKITNGTADASDVAIATIKHRLAIKGKINLVSERYESLTIGVLNEKGCATMKQTLNGPLKKPKVETKEALKNVTTALGGLLGFGKQQKTEDKQPAADAKCEVFYSGSVQQPK
jgi:AsmA protein